MASATPTRPLRAPAPAPLAARQRRAIPGLSKSRFTTGLQCHRSLWWSVNEPDAPELETTPDLQAVFDQGNLVGERARTYIPGGKS